jgi:molecular chaperone DnaJ
MPAGTQHGAVQRLRGEGPPNAKGSGRRDIHYRIRIEVPKELTDEQREAVARLAEALNGQNPRAELLGSSGAEGKVKSDG